MIGGEGRKGRKEGLKSAELKADVLRKKGDRTGSGHANRMEEEEGEGRQVRSRMGSCWRASWFSKMGGSFFPEVAERKQLYGKFPLLQNNSSRVE